MLKSSSALLAIINDILDLATIDRDAMELQLGDVDIQRTMHAAAEGVQDRLAEFPSRAVHRRQPDIGSFRADGQRVRQILFNLLSNAIGFSVPGQTVMLAALRAGGRDRVQGVTITGAASRRNRSTRCLVVSRAIRSIRAIAASALAFRSCAPSSNCMGASAIDSAPGEGTPVTCAFPPRRETGVILEERVLEERLR